MALWERLATALGPHYPPGGVTCLGSVLTGKGRISFPEIRANRFLIVASLGVIPDSVVLKLGVSRLVAHSRFMPTHALVQAQLLFLKHCRRRSQRAENCQQMTNCAQKHAPDS